jgi:hypothetical protein
LPSQWLLDGRMKLEQRVTFFEHRWPYFAGFGFPAAIVTVAFPSFISSGIFAFLFPMFIILAIIADPVDHATLDDAGGGGVVDDTTSGGGGDNVQRSLLTTLHVPIFHLARLNNRLVLWLLQFCLHRKNGGGRTGAAPAAAIKSTRGVKRNVKS